MAKEMPEWVLPKAKLTKGMRSADVLDAQADLERLQNHLELHGPRAFYSAIMIAAGDKPIPDASWE